MLLLSGWSICGSLGGGERFPDRKPGAVLARFTCGSSGEEPEMRSYVRLRAVSGSSSKSRERLAAATLASGLKKKGTACTGELESVVQ